MRLAIIISRLEKHITNAKKLQDKDISDFIVFNALAMECFQAVNSAIELGEFILTEKNLGFPSKYREIFEILYKSKIINKKNLSGIKRLIFLRNLIAHEYYTIKEVELKEMIKLLGNFNELIINVKKNKINKSKR